MLGVSKDLRWLCEREQRVMSGERKSHDRFLGLVPTSGNTPGCVEEPYGDFWLSEVRTLTG